MRKSQDICVRYGILFEKLQLQIWVKAVPILQNPREVKQSSQFSYVNQLRIEKKILTSLCSTSQVISH